jgi:IclR family mhp operon transcriptional activator
MTKTIQSLERGLQVLQALHATPISSLHEVHVLTRLPKPTLLRILHTLERSGLVSRRLADGRYRISANLTRLTRKRDRYDRVAEAAAPVLDRLCQKVSWPSDLMVPAGDHMEIRETSRTQSPFLIYYTKDRIGTPVNWLLSAVGRAYLAYCTSERSSSIYFASRINRKTGSRAIRNVLRRFSPKRARKVMPRAIQPSSVAPTEANCQTGWPPSQSRSWTVGESTA